MTKADVQQARRVTRRLLADWLRDNMESGKGAAVGQKWSQVALAAASGVSRETLWRILNQRSDADEDTLRKLQAVFGEAAPGTAGTPSGAAVPAVSQPSSATKELADILDELKVYEEIQVDVNPKLVRHWLNRLFHARLGTQPPPADR